MAEPSGVTYPLQDADSSRLIAKAKKRGARELPKYLASNAYAALAFDDSSDDEEIEEEHSPEILDEDARTSTEANEHPTVLEDFTGKSAHSKHPPPASSDPDPPNSKNGEKGVDDFDAIISDFQDDTEPDYEDAGPPGLEDDFGFGFGAPPPSAPRGFNLMDYLKVEKPMAYKYTVYREFTKKVNVDLTQLEYADLKPYADQYMSHLITMAQEGGVEDESYGGDQADERDVY
jgi:hypothetical protein